MFDAIPTWVLIVAAAVYSVVATISFINFVQEDAWARAYGWPAPHWGWSLFSALLWPVFLPVGTLLDLYRGWREG